MAQRARETVKAGLDWERYVERLCRLVDAAAAAGAARWRAGRRDPGR